MANYTISKFTYDGDTYNFKDGTINLNQYVPQASSGTSGNGSVSNSNGAVSIGSANGSKWMSIGTSYSGSSGSIDMEVSDGTNITSYIALTEHGTYVENLVTPTNDYDAATKKYVDDSIPTVPSAGTTATAVSTTSSGGSASTYSKSDHVHSISSSTITSALGYTPPQSDTNTTYTLSNALSSHKFTETLTAGGSGSGTSTATMEFVAGTGITLTDDTTNKKITIASSVTNTDEKVKLTSKSDSVAYKIPLAPSSITSGNTYEEYYSTNLTYNPSTKALVTGGTVDGYTLAGASAKAVDTSISDGSSSTNLPTSAAVASFVEGKGYITSDSDEKLITNAISSSDYTTYYPILGTDSSTASTKNYNNFLRFKNYSSEAQLTIGDGDSKRGIILLAHGGNKGDYTCLTPSGTFSARTITLPDKTGTVALTSDIPTVPSNIVNTISTSEGSYSALTTATGDVTITLPTKTSHITNDSGYITSYTDEKMKWTASTSSSTYYPLQSTSTATTSTANTLSAVSFYQYYNTSGGYRRLDLGNSTSYTSTGGAYGKIRLYGTGATYYGDLNPGTIGSNSLTGNRTWTLPNATGTIALTSDIPDTSTLAPLASPSFTGTPTAPTPGATAGDTEIATVKYVQDSMAGAGAGTVTSVGVSNATNGGLSVSGSPITGSGTITIGHSNVLANAQTTSAVYPIKIDKNGHISEYGSAVTIPSITLNGSSTTSPSFYAPTGVGTSGQYLKSNGSGAPSWTNFPTIPTITLNGSSTTSPSFYAPTTAGTSGYYLKSNGSGAPTWAAISGGGGISDVTVAGNSVVTNNVAVIAAPVQIVRW